MAELCFGSSWFTGLLEEAWLHFKAGSQGPTGAFVSPDLLQAPPAVPPLRWQDEPVSQAPLVGVGVGGQRSR